MPVYRDAIRTSLARGLLVAPIPGADVYWTPSVAARLASPPRGGGFIQLRYPDLIVGSYGGLSELRLQLRQQYPFLWLGTDIHHIVENQHLQFVGRRGVIGEHSYHFDEPCVLLPQDNHRLLMDSLIGLSETLERERRAEDASFGIDYIQEYNDYRGAHPVPRAGSRPTRTEKALHRADWVRGRGPGTRRRMGEMIQEIYDFAYQQSDETALGQIARDTIQALAR